MLHGSPSTYGKSNGISLPSFPGPTPQKASCFVSRDVPSSLVQLFSQQQVLKVLFPAHTCTHTLAITVDYRSPLSCPEYYYTDAKKTPNLSLNTEIKKQQYRKKVKTKNKKVQYFFKKKSLLVIYLPKQNHVHRKKTQHRETKGNL